MRMVFSDLLGILGRTRRFDRQLRDAYVARGSRVAPARVRALRHHLEHHPQDDRDLSSARTLRAAHRATRASAGRHPGEVQTRLLIRLSRTLSNNISVAARLGAAARRRAQENFTLQMKIGRILEIYESAIEFANVRA